MKSLREVWDIKYYYLQSEILVCPCWNFREMHWWISIKLWLLWRQESFSISTMDWNKIPKSLDKLFVFQRLLIFIASADTIYLQTFITQWKGENFCIDLFQYFIFCCCSICFALGLTYNVKNLLKQQKKSQLPVPWKAYDI